MGQLPVPARDVRILALTVPHCNFGVGPICDTLFRTRKEDYPKFANKPHPMDKVRNPGKDGKQKKGA